MKGMMEADGFLVHNEVDHLILRCMAPFIRVEVEWIELLKSYRFLDLGLIETFTLCSDRIYDCCPCS
jgi:hypothetical protein